MKVSNHNKTLGTQDDIGFDLTNSIRALQKERKEGVKPFLVKCHVCESQASVLINPKKKRQHCICRWCRNELSFLINTSGIYKVKSAMGIEEVNGNERKWIVRFNQ